MTNSKISSVKMLFCAVLFATLFISFSSNPPIGRTGAPGDGLCSDCHTGANPLGFDGGITIQNFPTTIVGGQTYSLTATVSNPNGLASLAGFQAVVLDDTNTNIGDLMVAGTNPITDTNAGGREYVEHNPAQNFSPSNDVVWSFDWVAPTGPNGTGITLYAAGNIASGSSGNQDDFIVTTSATGTLMGNPVLIVDATVTSAINCNGGSDGIATAVGSGGMAGYTYEWSNGTMGAIASNLAAGTYSVTVTDANLDTASTMVTLTQPTAFNLQLITTIDVDCINTTGSATLLGSGGTGPYLYNWPSGNTTETESGLAVGTYNITASDSNGCLDSVIFTIFDNANSPVADAGPPFVLNCNTTQITLDGTGSDMGAQFIYQWSTADGTIDSGDQTLTPLVSASGTYTLDVTNTINGCSSSDNVVVTTDLAPGITLSAMDVSCANGSDGSIDLTVTGGMLPFTFDWDLDTLDGQEDPTNLIAGTYAVTVTDANGCFASGSITVTQPTAIGFNAIATSPTCFDICDGAIDLTVSGGTAPYTFNWSNMTTSQNQSGLCAGSYSVTISDANGCDTTTTMDIIAPSAITITSLSTDETCAGLCDGTVTLAVVGGSGTYSYAWQNAPSNQTNLIIGCPGTYSVTVTDTNNCTSEYISSIDGPDSLLLTSTIVNSNCFEDCDGSILVSSTGGTGTISYLWSNGSDTALADDLCPGDYTVTATDANGCETIETYTVTEPSAITITESIINAGCTGECIGAISVVVTGGTGGFTYAWENIPGATTSINNLCAGIYALTVTDSNGCEGIGVYTVTEESPVIASITSTNETMTGAGDGTATVTVNGAAMDHTFLWSNAETTQTITGLIPASYSVTVTNLITGCVDSSSVVVNSVNCDLAGTISGTPVSCNGDVDGTATVQGENGTMPYSYIWSTGATGSTESGLPAGTVSCTLTDANECSEVLTFVVESPDVLTGTSTNVNVSCSGLCDGSISLDLFGGTQPYFITPNSLNNLCAGTYDILVTDARGCAFEISETIIEPSVIEANISSTSVTTIGGSDGTASTNATGGTGNYTYLWSNGGTASSIGNLIEGTYCVTITDENNCFVDTCTTVGPPGCLLDLAVTTVNPNCFGESNGSALATTTGGVMPYTYTWSTSSNQTNEELNLAAGSFSLTVTDANGCVDSTTFSILDGPSLALSIVSVAPTSCFGSCDGAAELSSPNFTFTWSDGATGSIRQDLCAGTYNVTATDGSCTDSIIVTINEPAPISLFMSNTDESSSGAADGTASAFPTGSTGNFTFIWNNSATTQVIENLSAGTYCVTVTSDSGCEETDCTVVNVVGCNVSVSLNQNQSTCFAACDAELVASITGGTAPFTINWSTGASATDTIGNLCAGTYSVTITDSLGCVAEATSSVIDGAAQAVSIVNVAPTTCFGNCDGSVELSSPNYTFTWPDGSTGFSRQDLCAGTYSVTATNGTCIDSITVMINEPAPISLLMSSTDESGAGAADGSASAFPTGSTGNFTFLWDNNETTQVIDNLTAGTYCVTVTSDSGCQAIDCTVVNLLGCDLAVSLNQNQSTCFEICDAELVASISGGTAPYTIDWSNGVSATDTLGDLCAGTYSVTITDSLGCVAQATSIISEYAEIVVVADIMNWADDCELPCDEGSIFLNVTGSGPFNYDWSLDTLDGTNGGSGICPGIYSCTITDGNGCTTIYESPQPVSPDPILISVNVFDGCFGECNGQVSFTIAGGLPPYQIQTDLPTNFSEVCPGDYFLSVVDEDGCENIENFTVGESMQIMVTIDEIGEASDADDGFINITASGTGPFTYSWNYNGNVVSMVEDPQNLAAGTYNLTMEDANGCEFTTSVVVPELVSTNNILTAERIRVYPNPASDFFNVNISLDQSTELEIVLFDVLGKNIYELKNWKGLEMQEVINTSNFSSGVYTLLIHSKDEYWTEKLVILSN